MIPCDSRDAVGINNAGRARMFENVFDGGDYAEEFSDVVGPVAYGFAE